MSKRQTVFPLKRTLAPSRRFVVLRRRPGGEPDEIWSFEADDEAAARAFAERWIPVNEWPRCEVKRKPA